VAPLSHYVAYLRPKTLPINFATALTGYAVSGARPPEVWAQGRDLALLFMVHSVLLWGGTSAFNSSQDRDAGPQNMLLEPPPLPPRLCEVSLALKLLAITLATCVSTRLAGLVALAAALSVFYSAKTRLFRRGKEIPIVDNAINAGGCGVLSILIGYAVTPASIDARVLDVGLAFTVAFFAGIPTSQIFQLRPGETCAEARNYTSLLGPARTLQTGAALLALHLVLLGGLLDPRPPSLAGRPWALALWVGWLGLASAAAIHSLAWARAPFVDPYRRMTRQLALLLSSQVCWSAAAWGGP
jgi:hypothetical protein